MKMTTPRFIASVIVAYLVSLSLPSMAREEVVSQLVAGEHGYEVPLEVVNRDAEPIRSVAVKVTGRPAGLVNFQVTPPLVESLPGEGVAIFTVSFDVKEDTASYDYAEIVLSVTAANADFDEPRPKVAVAVVEDDVAEAAGDCTVDKERVGGDWSGAEKHYVYVFRHHQSGKIERVLIYTGGIDHTFEIALQSSKDQKFGPLMSMAEAEAKAKEFCGDEPGDTSLALKLVRIDWAGVSPPMPGITHHPGDTGYSTHWVNPAGRVNKESYGFTRFPLEITLGQPFEFAIDMRSSQYEPARKYDPNGMDFSHSCRLIGEVWTQPLIGIAYSRYYHYNPDDPNSYLGWSGTKFEIRGEVNKFTCPGDYLAAVTVNQASLYVLKFAPVGPPPDLGDLRPHSFTYRVEASGKEIREKSLRALDGKTFEITGQLFESSEGHRELRSSGFQIAFRSAGGGRIGPQYLSYSVPTDELPGIHATPFTPPGEMTTATSTPGGGPGGPETGGPDDPGTGEPPPGSAPPGERTPDGTSPGDDVSPVGPSGVPPTGRVPPVIEPTGPIDPNSIDPASPDIAALIRQWITIAEPPKNVTEGANFHYNHRGKLVGTTRDGGIVMALHDDALPFDAGYLWRNRVTFDLDSVNHCRLEEYVVARLEASSIDHCVGRYKKTAGVDGPNPAVDTSNSRVVPNLKGKSESLAVAWLLDLDLRPVVIKGSPVTAGRSPDTVENQSPLVGAILTRGEPVTLWVYRVVEPAARVEPTPEIRVEATPGSQTDCDRQWPGTVLIPSGGGRSVCNCPSGSAWSKVQKRCLRLSGSGGDGPGGRTVAGCSDKPGTIRDFRTGQCVCPAGGWDAMSRSCVDRVAEGREREIEEGIKGAECEYLYSQIEVFRKNPDTTSQRMADQAERDARAKGCDPARISDAVVKGGGGSGGGGDGTPVPVTEPVEDKDEGEARVSTRNIKACVTDINDVLDDQYDLFVNGRFVGTVKHPEGGATCYNAMLRGGPNRLELRLVATRGKGTYLLFSINDGEFSANFGGSVNHIWNVIAP